MICHPCRKAADEDRQDLHCEDAGCTCQHMPRWTCLPASVDSDKE